MDFETRSGRGTDLHIVSSTPRRAGADLNEDPRMMSQRVAVIRALLGAPRCWRPRKQERCQKMDTVTIASLDDKIRAEVHARETLERRCRYLPAAD